MPGSGFCKQRKTDTDQHAVTIDNLQFTGRPTVARSRCALDSNAAADCAKACLSRKLTCASLQVVLHAGGNTSNDWNL
jgi:hypothetical protein